MSILKKWLSNQLVDQTIAQQAPQLTQWFQSDCGRLLLEAEQELVDQVLPSLFGYHLMQMSIHEGAELAKSSPINHRCKIISGKNTGSTRDLDNNCPPIGLKNQRKKTVLVSGFEELPFESDSIDIIILHHVLEFSLNPHQILKEINRVLIPRGHVIIIGFNPFSLFGLWKGVASLFSRQAQWQYNAITKWRLQDWFKLIDLNKVQAIDTFYRLPFSRLSWLKRFNFLESVGRKLRLPTGGAYIMVVRKDVNAVTPIRAPFKTSWEKTSNHVPGLATARPSGSTSSYSLAKNKNNKLLH